MENNPRCLSEHGLHYYERIYYSSLTACTVLHPSTNSDHENMDFSHAICIAHVWLLLSFKRHSDSKTCSCSPDIWFCKSILGRVTVKLIYHFHVAQNKRNQFLIDLCYHYYRSPSHPVFYTVTALLHCRVGLNLPVDSWGSEKTETRYL